MVVAQKNEKNLHNARARGRVCLSALTFDHVLNVSGVLQYLGQAIQQHGSLAVAVGDVFSLLEHLIQSRRLDLKHTRAQSVR